MDLYFAIVTSVALVVALAAFYLLARFSVAQGRFDTDATQRAVNLQRYIDGAVNNRVAMVNKNVATTTKTSGVPFDPQPTDPNVTQRGRVDDVHELEREAMRMTGEDEAPEAREYFDEQPAGERAITT